LGRVLAPARGLSLPVLNAGRPVFFDLSGRAKLRIAGGDVLRFLNGQVTNDIRKATTATAIQASILNPKGKLSAHVFISRNEAGGFLLDADPELREELPARLDRYIIADDVQLEDVTEGFGLFHFLGELAPNPAEGTRVVASDRFGMPGWDYWGEPAPEGERRRAFESQFDFCGEECAEVFRIERGIPRWGRELTNEIIPVEANLETSSIDYGKGCYIGQEVISRMKMSGQTNKRLCGLVSLNGSVLQPETRLSSETDAGREAGWITSAAKSERLGKQIALGYVKRGFNGPGTQLLAGTVSVEVTPLPFI
jgi:tRNA-modifying protein YgfZ